MTRFAAQGGGSGSIYTGGTFSGNPLVMAAGLAAVDEMAATRETLYPALAEKTHRFANAINQFCREENLPAQLMHLGSMFHLHFQADPIESSRDFTRQHAAAEREFYLHLIGHGVIVPGVHLAFFSAAHNDEDVDAVIAAFQQSFHDLRTDGLI